MLNITYTATMESITIIFLAIPIFLIIYLQRHKRSSGTPPGPSGLPFIGNLHQFDGENPHTYLYKISQKYGPIMSMKLGSQPLLVVSSSNIVKEIMKNDLAFSGRPAMKGLRVLSYNMLDILSPSYCETWRERRKMCTMHLFSLKQLQVFRPTREDEVSRLIANIAKDASESRVSDLSEMAISLSSNNISRMTLGKRIGEEREGNRFSKLFKETQAMMGGLFVGDYLPWLGWVDELSGMNKKLEKTFSDLDAFYDEVIEEHLDPNKPKSMEGDVVDTLLEMVRDESSSNVTHEHIKALLMNILAGGTDTSAAIIVWAMTALMIDPSSMKKVQTEIRELVGEKDMVNEDDIANLPYFKAVVQETFRLYPPGPLLAPRATMEKCTINGYEIQAGTMVYINAWAIGRDSENWKHPKEFMPERFLETKVDIKGHDPEVIPFGIGRRGCPAANSGLAIVELALANMLYKFDYEFPPGVTKENISFDTLPGLTMHKKTPLCLLARVAKV